MLLVVATGRILSRKLFRVQAFDPLTLASAIFALAVCAFIAGFVPARRAATIEPVDALRTE